MTSAVDMGGESVSLPVRGGIAVVLAVLVNVAIVRGVAVLGIAPDFRPLSIGPVAFLSALGAGGATLVYLLTDRYATNGGRTFVRVAAAVLFLSFVPDIGLLASDPAATPFGVVVLMAMHVVVAVVSVSLLVYWRAEAWRS